MLFALWRGESRRGCGCETLPTTATAAMWRSPSETRVATPATRRRVTWGYDHPRDAILHEIDAKALYSWKNESGYPAAQHRREHDVLVQATGGRPVFPTLRATSKGSPGSGCHYLYLQLLGHAANGPGRSSCAGSMKKGGDRECHAGNENFRSMEY